MKYTRAFIIALFACISAHCQAGDTYLLGPSLSYHANRDAHYNERNIGIGVMRRINDDWDASLYLYRNSERGPSVSTLANRSFTDWAIRPGIAGGLVTGYSYAPVLPVVAATLTAEVGPVIVRISAVPVPIQWRDSVIAVTVGIGF